MSDLSFPPVWLPIYQIRWRTVEYIPRQLVGYDNFRRIVQKLPKLRNIRNWSNKSHRISTRCRGIIAAVNAPIGVAIFQSVSECQCDEWRSGMRTLAKSPQNRLLWQRPLSDWKMKVRKFICIRRSTNPENLAKISLARSDIIALQRDRWKWIK